MQEVVFPNASNDRADKLKLPPYSIDAEQSVLGGLMIDNNTWEQVADQIVEDDFYRRDHRLIFQIGRAHV